MMGELMRRVSNLGKEIYTDKVGIFIGNLGRIKVVVGS
jgi:hypothetical protein